MKTVIFDFDGTIADNFGFVQTIIRKLAPKYGFDVKVADEVVLLRDTSLLDIVKRYKISRFNVLRMLLDSRKEMHKYLPEVKVPQGLQQLFQDLQAENIKVAIISSNSLSSIQEFLKTNSIGGDIDVESSLHLFGKSKAILKYMRKNAISRNNAIYVGDEVRDIDAAKEAEIPVVSVSWGYNTPEILRKNNDVVVSDVASLRLEIMKRFK